MATSQQLLLVAAAVALVLLVGADASGCPRGYKDCNPKKPGCETNIHSDIYNCGDCHKKCHPVYGADAKCYGGHCKYPCKKGYADCDKKWHNGCEVSTGSDPYNCGSCGYKCKQVPNAVTKCKDGKCGHPECNHGYGDCDHNPHNGCEKNLKNDIYNCGQCGNKCICTLKFGEATCISGKCGEQCKKGWTYHHVKKICYKSH